jgi:hypothetical protein
VTAGRRAGPALVPIWPTVPIDWPESSGYRLVIYSPSDTPVTASAGVFLFASAPSIRSKIAHGRVFKPTELAWEDE